MSKVLNKEQLSRDLCDSGQRVCNTFLKIVDEVFEQIDPYLLVSNYFAQVPCDHFENIYVIGMGKGTMRMAEAVEDHFQNQLTDGVVLVPKGLGTSKLRRIEVIHGGHPLPDRNGEEGARRILDIARKAGENDVVIALISGGGSALAGLPAPGITLDEQIELTKLLLACGAPIQEVNVVRKHISQIKGGRLAEAIYPATCTHLVISDVVGDDLSTIASGPLAPDESTFRDAIHILNQYKIWDKIPKSIRLHLEEGKDETPNPTAPYFKSIYSSVLANHETAAQKAFGATQNRRGFEPVLLSTSIHGECRDQAARLLDQVQETGKIYIAAGETTVTLHGKGKGGRNQEFALACLQDLERNPRRIAVLSIGTDGVDGFCPEPVAGAFVSPYSLKKAAEIGLSVSEYLEDNDSYHFLEKIGALIKTGPTGTNLGDLILMTLVN